MNEPNPVPYTAPQDPSIGMPSSPTFTTPTQPTEFIQAQVQTDVPSLVSVEQTEPDMPEYIEPVTPISPITPIVTMSPEVESTMPSASPQVSSVSNVSE
ncbi:MAG: hypothetical protein RIQ72_544, partial [Candidatus Parcubacteria bacterium]